MQTARRLEGIGEYYFSRKLREIEALNREGKNVINLGIGSPDLPPHPDVIRVLNVESARPDVHAYQSYKGSIVLRQAIAGWYAKWYGVTLDPESEILPLIGSKEGIMHICMTYLNEGDMALVPDPGYPTYSSAVTLAGGKCLHYSLKDENNWFPDFDALEHLIKEQQGKVKLLFANYPHMPTGQYPDRKVFEKLVAFAQKHDLLICHDNPYSFILNDRPQSMLATPGAAEIVLELNSLSKSHNMAGWRVGMLCAHQKHIEAVLRFKSNMDSGMFLPVQLAAATALGLGQDWHDSLNGVYRERRLKVFKMLDLLGCRYNTKQAGMFVWAAIPDNCSDGYALSDKILQDASVFITPGGIFGNEGKRYVRLSLCCKENKLDEAINRMGRMASVKKIGMAD